MTSLEERLKQLEELTSKLEEGNLSIDEAISVYSQGMDLAVSCKKSLDSLSQKITVARKKAQQSLSDDALSDESLPDRASDDALDELEAKSTSKSEDLPFLSKRTATSFLLKSNTYLNLKYNVF